MLDKGLSVRQAEDILEVAGAYIALDKLGWGTSLLTPSLEQKLACYRAANVPVYLGGTLFEAFYLRGCLDAYCRLVDRLGLQYVEVSNGTITLPLEEKLRLIRHLSLHFRVLSEVGTKDARAALPPAAWVEAVQAELKAGSWKVICEARESGTVGLYHPTGEVREELVEALIAQVEPSYLIFEAPQKAQQVWFVRRLGPNVNLGNIAPEEVLPLETLRYGLRADTLQEMYLLAKNAPSAVGSVT